MSAGQPSTVNHSWVASSDLHSRIDAGYYSPDALRDAEWISDYTGTLRSLSELAELITDGAHAMPTFVSEGPYWLTATNVEVCHLNIHAGYRRISEGEYLLFDRGNCCPKANDVLVAKSGKVGTSAVVPEGVRFACLHSIAFIRLRGGMDPQYVCVFLNAWHGDTQIQRFRKGAVQPMLHLEEIEEVLIPVVDDLIQRAIGNKVRKAERLRIIAEDEQSRCDEAIMGAWGAVELPTDDHFGWAVFADTEDLRIDAWFHQPGYVRMGISLQRRSDLVAVGELATRVEEAVRFDTFRSGFFDYFEISDMDLSSGTITANRVAVQDAPSRAKCAVRGGDLLVSTVRPNRKAIAIVPDDIAAAVCSSGFSVLRAKDIATAYFLRTCMIHDAVTHQLMRWNTGATYPAIEHEVPLEVLVPRFEPDEVQRIGSELQKSAQHFRKAAELVCQAKNDVEALIAGTLDEAALLAEGEEIERWLGKNPSPNARRKAT